MSVSERIAQLLEKELTPIFLEVTDFSDSHKGHAGYREGGESHFKVTIVSSIFSGKSRIERHKIVYTALEKELKQQIHALTLNTLSPEEAEKKRNF